MSGSQQARDFGYPGGRHLTTLQMYTWSRVRCMALYDPCQKLSGGPYEGLSAAVLFLSGPLPNEHQLSLWIAFAEDEMGSFGTQPTPGTLAKITANGIELLSNGLGIHRIGPLFQDGPMIEVNSRIRGIPTWTTAPGCCARR